MKNQLLMSSRSVTLVLKYLTWQSKFVDRPLTTTPWFLAALGYSVDMFDILFTARMTTSSTEEMEFPHKNSKGSHYCTCNLFVAEMIFFHYFTEIPSEFCVVHLFVLSNHDDVCAQCVLCEAGYRWGVPSFIIVAQTSKFINRNK